MQVGMGDRHLQLMRYLDRGLLLLGGPGCKLRLELLQLASEFLFHLLLVKYESVSHLVLTSLRFNFDLELVVLCGKLRLLPI